MGDRRSLLRPGYPWGEHHGDNTMRPLHRDIYGSVEPQPRDDPGALQHSLARALRPCHWRGLPIPR
jgi:hypothetical protein